MRRIILFTALFFVGFPAIFAFDVELEVDKNNVEINENINLKITVTDTKETVKIEKILGLENFEIVGKNNFNQSFTNIVVIDGKQERKEVNKMGIQLTLAPKRKGDLEIGPAEAKDSKETKKSNTVSVNVSGKKVQKFTPSSFTKEKDTKISPEKKGHSKYFFIQIISISLLLFIIIMVIIFSRNNQKGESDENEENNKEEKSEEKEVQEEKTLKIPNLEDLDFLENSEAYLKQFLRKKYKINSKLPLNSIIKDEQIPEIEREKLQELITIFEKIKYGNLEDLKQEFLEGLQKL